MATFRKGRRRTASSGQVVVIGALVMTVLIGIAGLVIDSSGEYDKVRRDQNVADAVALAASLSIYSNNLAPDFSAANAAAAKIATDDGCTSPCSVALTYLQSNGDVATSPGNTYKVKAIVSDAYTFYVMDAITNTKSASFSKSAVAKVGNGGLGLQLGYPVPCQLCLLESSGTGLELGANNINLSTSTGDFDINANADVSGNGITVTLTGGYHFNVHGTLTTLHSPVISPPPVNPAPAITDPLTAVPTPSFTGTNFGDVTVTTNTTLTPGNYGTVSVTSSATTLTLAPGTYVFAGGATAGLQLSATQTILAGTGVTMYFTCGTSAAPAACAAGASGATINFTGQNSQFNVGSPTTDGPYYNLLVFFDRNNHSLINLTGNSLTGTASGAVYAQSAPMTFAGNSGSMTTLAPLILASLNVTGNGFTAGGISRVGQMPIPGGLIQ